MIHQVAKILEQREIAKGTFLICLECPEIAMKIQPGQFFMVRLPELSDPLLGRPFALYDTEVDSQGSPIGVWFAYIKIGKMTGILPTLEKGKKLDIWGPLGTPFPIPPNNANVALIAGGIGQTPFFAFAKKLLGLKGYGGECPNREVKKTDFFYGVRSKAFLAGVDDFFKTGLSVYLATEDGTAGHKGRITELFTLFKNSEVWFGCGPEPMLKSLAILAQMAGVRCYLSLETPMACGLGICFSCVTKVKTSGSWDYKRVCVDGPVFDSATLLLDE